MMESVSYEERRAAVRDRFLVIATETGLRRRDANRSSFDLTRLQASGDADERLTAYATEMLSVEGYRLTDSYEKTLSPRLKERFDAVGAILDRHIDPGEHGADKRRAILERAEEYACFSPHYHGPDETDDNEGIRDELNEIRARRQLPRYLLDRELGLPLGRYPNLGPNAINPDYTGELKRNFTARSARELTDALGHLHQTLYDRIRDQEPCFVDVSVDDAIAVQRTRWPLGEQSARLPKMEQLGHSLAEQPQERALIRTRRKQTERAERLQREMSDDSFLREPSPKPVHTLKRRRSTSGDENDTGEGSSRHPPARRRRLMPREQREPSSPQRPDIHHGGQPGDSVAWEPNHQDRDRTRAEPAIDVTATRDNQEPGLDRRSPNQQEPRRTFDHGARRHASRDRGR